MIEFPTIPAWGEAHAMIIHFPIAILLTAPLFILVGLFFKKNGKFFNYSALILMLLGFFGLAIALASGEASADLVSIPKKALETLEKHKELSIIARNLYAGLIMIFALLIYVPLMIKKELTPSLNRIVSILFVVVYMFCSLSLINAADTGKALVHTYGVKAKIQK